MAIKGGATESNEPFLTVAWVIAPHRGHETTVETMQALGSPSVICGPGYQKTSLDSIPRAFQSKSSSKFNPSFELRQTTPFEPSML